MSPANAHGCLQRALNRLGAELTVDGAFGPKTLKDANAAEPEALLEALCEELADYYRKLAAARPTLAEFLPGWLKRAAWRGRPGDF